MLTLPIATKDFLLHCKFEKNLSDKTLKAYQIDLFQIQSFFSNNLLVQNLAEITRNHIREYLVYISKLKPATVKRKIASTKALFNYLEFEDKILINPFRKMKLNIKEPRRLPKVMDFREISIILSAAYNKLNGLTDYSTYRYFECMRNIVVIELLFTTGARVSEISGLTKESVNLKTGNIHINGKGGRERLIQICNKETITILNDYYKYYHSKIERSGNYFFVNRFGFKLSEQSIRKLVNQLALDTKINKHITPHMFRHSFATLLLEKDVDIKYIQTLLGHSSIMTTQIYTHVNQEKQRQILKAKHPRKDFSVTK